MQTKFTFHMKFTSHIEKFLDNTHIICTKHEISCEIFKIDKSPVKLMWVLFLLEISMIISYKVHDRLDSYCLCNF